MTKEADGKMAQLFHAEGARLALMDLSEEALAEVAAQTGATAIPIDLANTAAIEALS
jgi:NADP-dependent 3-hydroxy acid dehydrogenase YdfG